jgi:hypothetical protein
MGGAVNAGLLHPVRNLRVHWARSRQLIGWAGLLGVALIVAALCVAGFAWSAHRVFLQSAGARGATALTSAVQPNKPPAPPQSQTVAPDLPRFADVPLLLTQLEQAAISNGIAWRAAEYRITAATASRPASLEVRSSPKGPYPKLRSMLVQLMNDVPAFTIREFSVSRPNSDTADVEAKLLLAVFLRDDASAIDAPLPKATP